MMKLLTLVAALFVLPTLASAQYLDARNNAMGGVGTASSHYLSAGFANPALLTRARADDRFGIMLPSIGVIVADEDDLLGNLDEFVDGVESLQTKITNGNVTAADRTALSNRLLALRDSRATANLGVGFAIAMPSDGFAWAIHGHTYNDLHVVSDIDPADATRFQSASSAAQLDNLGSGVLLLGVSVTEIGLSLAKKFDLGGAALSLGITPKLQRIDTINYAVNINSFEDDDFDDDKYTNDETAINANFGAALEFNDSVTIGLMVRNLVRDTYATVNTSTTVPPDPGGQFQYTLKPTATIGAAWTNQILTLAVDTDITTTARFENRTLQFGSVFDDDSRFVRGGLEIDSGWVQLRGGIQTDLEKTVDDLLTGGIGLGLFGVWHLDVGATYSGDSLGGIVQMAFTF